MAEKTIDKIKKAKVDLESEITEMLKTFEDTYGVRLGYISIQRKEPKKTKKQVETLVEDYDNRPLETVEIDLRIP